MILTATIRFSFFVVIYHIKSVQRSLAISSFVSFIEPFVKTMENILSISSTFTLSLGLIARVLNGKCQSLSFSFMFGCNSELDSNALPQEHLVLLMMLPLIFSVVFKVIEWQYIVLSWITVIVTIIVCISLASATQSIPCLVLYMLTSGMILWENQRQNIILFFMSQRKQILLAENKAFSDEAQNELRHMIANVAHDLKTVNFFCLFSLY